MDVVLEYAQDLQRPIVSVLEKAEKTVTNKMVEDLGE
jgi:hypothetical protein